MSLKHPTDIVTIDPLADLWKSCFTPAPLVLIGSRDASGEDNFAPKHMVTPLGPGPYFGFVCTPRHSTYRNIEQRKEFTVSFPRPSQIILASLAAAPRAEDDSKPALRALPTFPAQMVAGSFLEEGYLFLECRLERLIEGFGEHCLVAGRVIRTHVHRQALRATDRDDQGLLAQAPLLVYVQPGRFASISDSLSFPFPLGFEN